MKTWSLGLGALVAVLALGACGGGSRPTPNTNPCVGYGALAAPPKMLYPPDGATSVPDGNFSLVLSRSAQSVQIAAGGKTVVALPVPVPNPLPTPNATPAPGITPGAFAVPPLHAATMYSVYADYGPPAPGCGDLTQPVGSFTTR
jgi:hypothetical protein